MVIALHANLWTTQEQAANVNAIYIITLCTQDIMNPCGMSAISSMKPLVMQLGHCANTTLQYSNLDLQVTLQL